MSLGLRGETRDGRVADTCRREIKVEKIVAQIKGRGLLRHTIKRGFEQKESKWPMGGSKDESNPQPSLGTLHFAGMSHGVSEWRGKNENRK